MRDLAEARGVPIAKYLSGLGTQRMCVARANEDSVTLATAAGRRALVLAKCDPSEIGLCIVGTETAVDHSKPVTAFLHSLLRLPTTCRVFETKHACFGGTAGLFNALDWIASGSARGRAALVICTDIARYPVGSAGEPTQGAGAVAMIVSGTATARWSRGRPKRNVCTRCLRFLAASGSEETRWWTGSSRSSVIWMRSQAPTGSGGATYNRRTSPTVRTCYHVPYGKWRERRIGSVG